VQEEKVKAGGREADDPYTRSWYLASMELLGTVSGTQREENPRLTFCRLCCIARSLYTLMLFVGRLFLLQKKVTHGWPLCDAWFRLSSLPVGADFYTEFCGRVCLTSLLTYFHSVNANEIKLRKNKVRKNFLCGVKKMKSPLFLLAGVERTINLHLFE